MTTTIKALTSSEASSAHNDETRLDAAWDWLYQSRKTSPDNADFWDLRHRWSHYRNLFLAQLQSGTYQLRPMWVVGRKRHVMWSAEDALALKWVALGLEGQLPLHANCDHVKGHGGGTSVKRLTETLTEQGYHWVCCTDIQGYYQHIDKTRLLSQLEQHITRVDFLNLLTQYVRYSVEDGGGFHTPTQGIARGCALSPLMGALYLYVVDAYFAAQPQCHYIRYMDDFIFLSKTRWQLRKQVKSLNQFFAEFGFTQHPDKTFIGRVKKGFDWLGAWLTDDGAVGIAPRALANPREKLRRLYERTCHWTRTRQTDRVSKYKKHWWMWLTAVIQAPKLPRTSCATGNGESPPETPPRRRTTINLTIVTITWSIMLMAPLPAESESYNWNGFGETSVLTSVDVSLGLPEPEAVRYINLIPVRENAPLWGGFDDGLGVSRTVPYNSYGYSGWAIPGCDGCVVYLTGTFSRTWARIRCCSLEEGYNGTSGWLSFTDNGVFTASGSNTVIYSRYAIPGNGGYMADSSAYYWGRGDAAQALQGTVKVSAYVPLTVPAGTYQLPTIRAVQGIVTSEGAYASQIIMQGDTLIVPLRVTTCGITYHDKNLKLTPNVTKTTSLNFQCTGPEPIRYRVEMTAGLNSKATSDGMGMAISKEGEAPMEDGRGVILRGTASGVQSASCDKSGDEHTLYWDTPGKGGLFYFEQSTTTRNISWIACITGKTLPGKYEGTTTLKFIYQ